jgi:fucose permease
MIAGAAVAVLCYLVASLSPWPIASLAACVLAGLAVSLLWPGMLSITAARFPLAGASMFALMSASGDIGGAVAPWLVGAVADRAPLLVQLAGLLPAGLTTEQIGLRAGLLLATIYPLVMVVLLFRLRAEARRASAAVA